MDLSGLFSYFVFFLVIVSVYGLLSLGLNIQWGYTKLFNIGIAGFFAVGAYTSAILTTPPSPDRVGGFNMPFLAAFVIAFLENPEIFFSMPFERRHEIENQMDAILSSFEQ